MVMHFATNPSDHLRHTTVASCDSLATRFNKLAPVFAKHDDGCARFTVTEIKLA